MALVAGCVIVMVDPAIANTVVPALRYGPLTAIPVASPVAELTIICVMLVCSVPFVVTLDVAVAAWLNVIADPLDDDTDVLAGIPKPATGVPTLIIVAEAKFNILLPTVTEPVSANDANLALQLLTLLPHTSLALDATALSLVS